MEEKDVNGSLRALIRSRKTSFARSTIEIEMSIGKLAEPFLR